MKIINPNPRRRLRNKAQGTKIDAIWFYEEPTGLAFVIQGWNLNRQDTTQFKLPRRYLEGYVRRANKERGL